MACVTCGRAHVPERCKDGQIEYLAGLFPCPLKAAPAAPPEDTVDLEFAPGIRIHIGVDEFIQRQEEKQILLGTEEDDDPWTIKPEDDL